MGLEDMKEFLGVSASITQIFQFLSGILVCRTFMRKGTSDDVSSIPFLAGFLSCSLWAGYARLLNDSILIYINILGSLLMFSYVCAFYVFTTRKGRLLKQIILVITVIILARIQTRSLESVEEAKGQLGILCTVVSLFFFAAPLANLRSVLKVKSSESLPFPLIVTSFLATFQWFLYGCVLQDVFIMFLNLSGFVLSFFQLTLFWIYPKQRWKHANLKEVTVILPEHKINISA